MREHSSTAKTLLAEIGMTAEEELHAMSKPGDAADGPAVATARLANDAWMAIVRIDDAERGADQALAKLAKHLTEQTSAALNGHRRNAAWLQQATTMYAEQIATIDRACEAYRAAAMPLAALLGRPYGTGQQAAA